MKLLVCIKCNDIFNLAKSKKKTCSCKKSWGRYLSDGYHAEYSGPCLPLGFANGSFIDALKQQPEKDFGKEFKAFVIQKECPTMMRIGKPPKINTETEEQRMFRLMEEIRNQANQKVVKKSKRGRK